MSAQVRSSALLLAALALGGAAVAGAPSRPASSTEGALAPPPTPAAAHVAALGRPDVAADILWLRTVQYIGSPHSAGQHYAGMPAWIAVINELAPAFELPYYHASVLLSTEPGMTAEAAAILERGERNLVPDACRDESACVPVDRSSRERAFETCAPCEALEERDCTWALPMSRAFVSYFGDLDANEAAAHYCTASRRGGPSVTRYRAATLSDAAATCPAIRQELLNIMRTGETAGGASVLSDNRVRVAVHCEEQALKTALGAFRIRFGREPKDAAELVDNGLLDQPPWSPSPKMCWDLSGPSLEECEP